MTPIFLRNALRGILKGFPAINAIVEIARNKKAKKAIQSGINEGIAAVNENSNVEPLEPNLKNDEAVRPPHSWVSIFFQLITVAIVLYSFFEKQLTPEAVINLLQKIALGF